MRPLNILSLFDGISCGHLALDRAGIPVDKYYAAEIDKWAIKCTQHNYPDTIQLGDVTQWYSWDVPWEEIDLIFAGFPCQAWSLAGKQLGDRDERGKLFWVMLDIISHVQSVNPNVKFLIENVKMKAEFEQYITYHTNEALGGVEKVLINSSLVSAQNRNRYYWYSSNWCSGTSTDEPVSVPQPKDKQIFLSDILEDGYTDREKSYCIDACYYKGGDLNQYFNKSRRQLVFHSEEDYIQCHSDHSLRGLYRKLTPIEVERLQTVPENYTACLSNTQRYKTLGNGWTVDVIAHILSCMD